MSACGGVSHGVVTSTAASRHRLLLAGTHAVAAAHYRARGEGLDASTDPRVRVASTSRRYSGRNAVMPRRSCISRAGLAASRGYDRTATEASWVCDCTFTLAQAHWAEGRGQVSGSCLRLPLRSPRAQNILCASMQVPKVQALLRLVRQAFKALQAPGAEPKAPLGGGPDAETAGAASRLAAATVASFEVRPCRQRSAE